MTSSSVTNGEAAHEFGALNTLLLVVILGLCVLSAYLIKKNSLYYLPDSAVAITVGMVVGGLAKLVYPSVEELNFLTFEPEMFFFLLLPPIIFEAGYSLKKKDFFANFWTISLFAVFGTIVSTFVIGFIVYWVALLGIVDLDTTSPMEALVFGALISAVDPVATLAIMGNPELNCEPLLYALVFGESVLNDAVSIVLFKTFMASYESGQEFNSSALYSLAINFTTVSLGSLVVGVVIGLICSYLCKHTNLRAYPEYEITLLFLFAYGSFAFSEALDLSGIMALFFNGIVLSHYNSYNLSPMSQVTAHNIFKSLAVLSEYFVFLYIGMGIFTGRFKHFHFLFFAICIFACLVGRVANIFPLSFLANFGRRVKIPLPMQTVMWFAGLRGAIAFALSQNMPLEHREVYVSTTLLIVIATTIVCGALTEPMLSSMGMRLEKNDSEHDRDSHGSPQPSYPSASAGHSASSSTSLVGMGGGGGSSSGGGSGGGSGNAGCGKGDLGVGSGSSAGNGGGGAGGGGSGGRPPGSSDGLIRALSGLVNRTLGSRGQGVELTTPDRSAYQVCADESQADMEEHDHEGSSHGLLDDRAGNRQDVSSSTYAYAARRSFVQSFDAEIMSPLFGGPRSKSSSREGEDDADLHCNINDLLRRAETPTLPH